MQRKIIQLAVHSEGEETLAGIYALCDDGSVFGFYQPDQIWEELPPIPQKPVERDYIGQKKD